MNRTPLRPESLGALLLAACGGQAADSSVTHATIPSRAGALEVAVDVDRLGSATAGLESVGGGSGLAARAASRARPNITVEPLTLVPGDAVAVVRCRSVEALEEALLKLTAIAGRAGAPMPAANYLSLGLGAIGLTSDDIDASSPVVLALRVPDDAMVPEWIAYVPGAAKRPMQHPDFTLTAAAGGYSALLPNGGSVPAADCPEWCAELPDELLVARIDAETLYDRFGLLMASALAELAPDESAPAALRAQFAHEREMLLGIAMSAKLVDVVLDIDEGVLSIDGVLESEGGPIEEQTSTRGNCLAKLSHHLVSNAPIVLAFAFDAEKVPQATQEEFQAALESLPPAVRGSLEMLYDATLGLASAFDPGVVVQIDPTPGEMQLSVIMRSANPSKSHDAMNDVIAGLDFEALGFELSMPVRSRVGLAVVEDYTVQIDTRHMDFDERAALRRNFEQCIGDESLHLKIASAGAETMWLLCGNPKRAEQRLREFSVKREVPPAYSEALARLEGMNPVQWMRIDALRLATLPAEFAAAASGSSAAAGRREALRGKEIPGGIPMVAFGGLRSDGAFGSVEIDLAAVERAVEFLVPR